MCDICDELERLTGRKLTPEEAADLREKDAKMDAINKALPADVQQFATAMREKYGPGTYPPLVNQLALLIGNLLGQLDDDVIRGRALEILFNSLHRGFNQVLPKDKQVAFSITTTTVNVEALQEHLETLALTQVKPPVIH